MCNLIPSFAIICCCCCTQAFVDAKKLVDDITTETEQLLNQGLEQRLGQVRDIDDETNGLTTAQTWGYATLCQLGSGTFQPKRLQLNFVVIDNRMYI